MKIMDSKDLSLAQTGGVSRIEELEHSPRSLEQLLGDAVRALTVLDAEAIEDLVAWVEAGGRVDLPQSAAERERAAAGRWVFRHLLGSTARNLLLLRPFSLPAPAFPVYGPPSRKEQLESSAIEHLP